MLKLTRSIWKDIYILLRDSGRIARILRKRGHIKMSVMLLLDIGSPLPCSKSLQLAQLPYSCCSDPMRWWSIREIRSICSVMSGRWYLKPLAGERPWFFEDRINCTELHQHEVGLDGESDGLDGERQARASFGGSDGSLFQDP